MDQHVDPPADDASDEEHSTGVVRGLLASLLDAMRTRLDLAAVEAEIFLQRTIQMLLWASAALACALLALAFTVVAIVAALWDSHRMAGVLGGAGLFAVLAAVFGFVAQRAFRVRTHVLSGTLSQLESDQQRMKGTS